MKRAGRTQRVHSQQARRCSPQELGRLNLVGDGQQTTQPGGSDRDLIGRQRTLTLQPMPARSSR
ncbi:MAG: hypothetical protein LC798_06865 [Chloroflexi bacterium]|nr:hypothetical protein [Chloroflexota bacterium]